MKVTCKKCGEELQDRAYATRYREWYHIQNKHPDLAAEIESLLEEAEHIKEQIKQLKLSCFGDET